MLKISQNEGYIAGLDGLRAFAVLAVFAYHFGFSWARGGFLGVDIFFVISGYLITSILMPEDGNELNVTLRHFWMGRIRRLIPAAYLMIAVTFVWVVLFRPDLSSTVQGDAVSSVFYTSNWWFIFHKLSYFDSFGSPSPLKNLWSLAIEEQFYLIWPLALAAGLKLFKKRSHLAIAVLAGALGSALLMALMYQPGTDPSRVYYGTDTRSFELLIGCFFAVFFPIKKLSKGLSSQSEASRFNKILPDAAGIAAFGLFLLSVFFVDEFQDFPYRGGMLLFCLNSAVLVISVCRKDSRIGRLLALKPLRWIGTRSYGIYLWHYPVIILSTPVYEIGHPVFWRAAAQVLVTFAMAELSYRLIEMPIRRLGFRGYLKSIGVALTERKDPYVRKAAAVAAVLAFIVLTAGSVGADGQEHRGADAVYPNIVIGGTTGTAVSAADPDPTAEKPQETQPVKQDVPDKKPEQGTVPKNDAEKPPVSDGAAAETPPGGNDEPTTGAAATPYKKILGIGDSIMIDISPSLNKKYSNITIDGKVGRQMNQAIELAPKYASFNQGDSAVIIELGTNGYFSEAQFDRLLDSFRNSTVFLINTRVPRSWEYKVNEALSKKALERDNVELIDWYSAAVGHPEYFSADGVHLRQKGVAVLTSLIDRALSAGEGK